jgi:5-methylthioribose kinase
MWELTTDNAADYLRQRGWIGAGRVRIEALSGGVSNLVLRVESGEERFVLKQSRPRLRTRDDWFSDIERVYREQEVMELLQPLLPPLAVPAVLHVDRENFVFAMQHAPGGSIVWKEQLLAGETDLVTAERAGRLLGRIHQATYEAPARLSAFRDRTVFEQLRVDPYYCRVQQRRPEVADAVALLIDELRTRAEALCHGDFSPKNLLVHSQGLTLVDYETAHLGDPTMDLGFFFSHLVLKTVNHDRWREDYLALTVAAWRGYAAEVRFRPLAELVQRGIGHLGVCLLARIDGTSPVEYLTEELKREMVRRLGRSLLWDRPGTWDEVMERVRAELHHG